MLNNRYKITSMMSIWLVSVVVVFSAVAKEPSRPAKKESGQYANMTYDQLKDLKKKTTSSGNDTATISCLERMVKLCTVTDELSDLFIELADCYFKTAAFNKATAWYEKFASLYPGSARAEYALYRAIVAGAEVTNPSDRDQTKTEEMIALTDKFLKNTTFVAYKEQVHLVRNQLFERLFHAETQICLSQLTNKNVIAANRRLDYVRTTLVPRAPSLEPHLLAFEAEFAQKVGDEPLVVAKRAQLHEQYPEQEIMIAAKQDNAAKTSWFKVWA